MPVDLPAEPRADRRAALKARTRRNIVDAATGLMHETAGIAFSVEDLAARAGVSRRTVFNHFASLDDVVAAVGAEIFGAVREALPAVDPQPAAGPAGDPRAAALADLVGALHRADLVGPMASLTRGLGLQGAPDDVTEVPPHQAMLLLRSLSDVSEDLAADLVSRHPRLGRLDVDLLVAQAMSSLVVLHRHWYARTGAATDAASRRLWTDLLDHLSPGTSARPSEGHHG
ncbi:TetR/AcrR family transcriptional regulator [Isoptericola sp. 4D.3]|uniref:TetR/AcrR family transcriptional regulator n=1 Tax=Isoptericola peretonis TaxID=2918523 RepID=A0ABT0J3Q1_9MICO|nr:TetR/AcrR family transcriptional regulator [Isoptericola sp. 4D.3]